MSKLLFAHFFIYKEVYFCFKLFINITIHDIVVATMIAGDYNAAVKINFYLHFF